MGHEQRGPSNHPQFVRMLLFLCWVLLALRGSQHVSLAINTALLPSPPANKPGWPQNLGQPGGQKQCRGG